MRSTGTAVMPRNDRHPWEQQRLETLQREGPDRETFLQWRSPRFGTHNPERLTNRFWTYAIRHGGSSWSLNEDLDGPDQFEAGPCFSFQRYGQAEVALPDGRRVLIGGAHEGFYDPGFCIYNDVVVIGENEVSIYGYPSEVFPPTDYASATLIGDEIWIIGNLGYQDQRQDGPTPVHRLSTVDWSIRSVQCNGDDPGSIWGHRAERSSDGKQVLISGGERHCRLVGLDDQSLINPDHHVLNLATLTWTTFSRETECRQWQLRSVETSVLERCRVKDFTSIPDSNQLKEALVSGPEDLCFQIDHGNLDTAPLRLSVRSHGRYAIATLQGPIETYASSHDLERLLNDLSAMVEQHYRCGAVQRQLMQRRSLKA